MARDSRRRPRDLLRRLDSTLGQSSIEIVDQHQLPERAARFEAAPLQLVQELRTYLATRFPRGLYQHQARAIASVLQGEDVCLATPTASGKSLAFMAASMHLALSERQAVTLALYPARALIQDQLQKWREFSSPFSVPVGFVDGGVPRSDRERILRANRILLMTPDVMQAWLMAECGSPPVNMFLRRLQLLVLDEAHVYNGVFGTNMAYLIRRIRCAAGNFQIISSTATIRDPGAFLFDLSGTKPVVFDRDDDGSEAPARTIFLCQHSTADEYEAISRLLTQIVRSGLTPFLAFADSRRRVESLVARTRREEQGAAQPETLADESDLSAEDAVEKFQPEFSGVLPYRAGYEAADRLKIQHALQAGRLAGVVSTSALELGIDIGDIDLVVLWSLPRTPTSLWQRMGRMGRRRPGACIILCTRDEASRIRLADLLNRPLERQRLYLENRYIQYTHALCAARESASLGGEWRGGPIESLPRAFSEFLENELTPSRSVDADLFPLKQRAADSPHMEFPLRSAGERTFRVVDRCDRPLGTLSFDQVLREAYPGAVYYYLARPYRVRNIGFREARIRCWQERFYTTKPVALNMVFPDLARGVLQGYRNGSTLLVEAEMQVSERVTGFVEIRGGSRRNESYGHGSKYSQSPLQRYFRTTGVCWSSTDRSVMSEETAAALLASFVDVCGVHERDIGLGTFKASDVPFEDGQLRGFCIYDVTAGSLRLTSELVSRFSEIAAAAEERLARLAGDRAAASFAVFKAQIREGEVIDVPSKEIALTPLEENIVQVVNVGSRAIRVKDGASEDVTVKDHRYTPRGLLYELEPPDPSVRLLVPFEQILPIPGESEVVLLDLNTMETRPRE